MTWWRRSTNNRINMSDAEEAVKEATEATTRVAKLNQVVLPGLRRLEAHRQDNHILDAMMNTIVRRT